MPRSRKIQEPLLYLATNVSGATVRLGLIPSEKEWLPFAERLLKQSSIVRVSVWEYGSQGFVFFNALSLPTHFRAQDDTLIEVQVQQLLALVEGQKPKRESTIFREAVALMANPHTAKQVAELWNEATSADGLPVFPFEIDMSDPDAPWNRRKEEV